MTFTPDEQGEKVAVANPFNGKNAGKFLAEAISGDNDYVFVLTADSSYLRVVLLSLTKAVRDSVHSSGLI